MNKYEVETVEGGRPIKSWTRGVVFEDQARQQVRKLATLPFIFRHVAVMPDVHAGIGSTVGSVIAPPGAIIPAAVGVDIGCFTGDTEIPLLDGKSYKIADLVDLGEFWVWSVDPSHKIVAAKATAKMTRSSAGLVRVTLDSGDSVRCTPDHEFMLRDGTFKEAQQLVDGDSLMPFYSRKDRDGYTMVSQPYSGHWQRAHWTAARSGMLGKVPAFDGQRTIIHHKNFNESDNRPENLEFMGHCDHSAYHRGLVERNEHWQSAEFEAKRVAALAAKAATPEGHAFMSARGIKNLERYMAERPEHFKASVAGNGKRGAAHLIAYNKSEKGRAKSRENGKFNAGRRLCPGCRKMFLPGTHTCSREYPDAAPSNHKVVSVVVLQEREDVFCLTVPGLNNFAISVGVFVHNCGMVAHRTSLKASDLPDNLHEMRCAIEQAVPHGRTDDGGANDRGAWHDVPDNVAYYWNTMNVAYKEMADRFPKINRGKTAEHLGTLGSGNHFVELCLDKQQNVWVMLHSGSRGVGNRIGQYFIAQAKQDMKVHHIDLPDQDLAYLSEGTDHYDDYCAAVAWAQNFAKINRKVMMNNTIRAITGVMLKGRAADWSFQTAEEAINCHHNYVSHETHYGEEVIVTRKGAVRADAGMLGIIPGSMGARSFIVRGLGNAESFNSCSHGAGRVMSRTQAKKTFTVADHIAATAGVECRKDADVLDETPAAYKDIQAVMDAQSDLVEIVYELKQVLCVKG